MKKQPTEYSERINLNAPDLDVNQRVVLDAHGPGVRTNDIDLVALRHQHPFVPIYPVPSLGMTWRTSTTAVSMNIPEGVVMARFSIPTGQTLGVGFSGEARLPSATGGFQYDTFINPAGWLYISGKRMMSLISDVADNYVGIEFFQQL